MNDIRLSNNFLQDMALDELLPWFNDKSGNEDSWISFETLKSHLLDDAELLKKRQKEIQQVVENLGLYESIQELVNISEQISKLSAMQYDNDDNSVISSFTDLVLTSKKLVLNLNRQLDDIPCKGLLMSLKDWVKTLIKNGFINILDKWEKTCCKEKSSPKSLNLHLDLDDVFSVKQVYIDKVFSDGNYKNSFGESLHTQTQQHSLERLNVFTSKGDRFISIISGGHVEDPYGDTNLFDFILHDQLLILKKDIQSYLVDEFSFVLQHLNNIKFLLSCSRFCYHLKELALPHCFPIIFEKGDRIFYAENSYSLVLAHRFISKKTPIQKIIFNRISFPKKNSTLIITGANQGGKTTYLQSIGLIQFLTQLGLMVPCSYAKISPVNRIYTIFASAEDTQDSELSREFTKVLEMTDEIDRYSLILFNEPFMCTLKNDGIYFCRQIMAVLMSVGCKSVWVTHLFELTDSDFFNFMGENNGVLSLYMQPLIKDGEYEATYHIKEGKSEENSHAWDILQKKINLL